MELVLGRRGLAKPGGGGGGRNSVQEIHTFLQLLHSFSKSVCFGLMRSSARTYWHTEERHRVQV